MAEGAAQNPAAQLPDAEAAATIVGEDDTTRSVPCGRGLEPVLGSVGVFLDAGCDPVYFHRIGPDQDRCFRFWGDELQPALAETYDASAS